MEMSPTEMKKALKLAQAMGENGDTMLVHVNKAEADLLDQITDGGRINPNTGLIAFDDGDFGADSGGDWAGSGYGGAADSGAGTGAGSDFGAGDFAGVGGTGAGYGYGDWDGYGSADFSGSGGNGPGFSGMGSGPGGYSSWDSPHNIDMLSAPNVPMALGERNDSRSYADEHAMNNYSPKDQGFMDNAIDWARENITAANIAQALGTLAGSAAFGPFGGFAMGSMAGMAAGKGPGEAMGAGLGGMAGGALGGLAGLGVTGSLAGGYWGAKAGESLDEGKGFGPSQSAGSKSDTASRSVGSEDDSEDSEDNPYAVNSALVAALNAPPPTISASGNFNVRPFVTVPSLGGYRG